MFKPHKGTCKECGIPRLIVVKAMLCNRCNDRKKKASKLPSSKTSGKKTLEELKAYLKPKKRKVTGELDIFKELWSERSHVCQVTGTLIRRFDIRCFSHLLTKAAYPSLRLCKDNLWIVQPHIHVQWEIGDRQDSIFAAKRDAADRLKEKYYKEHKQQTFE